METAKDKAKSLVEKYSQLVRSAYPKDAVECAKIAVDEILELNVAWIGEGIQKDYPKRFDLEQTIEFWQEVKNELNKM